MTTIGSLFSGAGAFDLAIQHVFDAHTAWHAEIDGAASKVLDAHWPATRNLGDITAIDWRAVPPVDIICGGFPCTDVSPAGRRAGLREGTRSGLWSRMADAIDALAPSIVVIENVRGLLSAQAHRTVESGHPAVGNGPARPALRAAGAVLGDLADLRYDAQWVTVAASTVGAPHRRERVFIIAADTRTGPIAAQPRTPRQDAQRAPVGALTGRGSAGAAVELLPTPCSRDHKASGPRDSRQPAGAPLSAVHRLLPTPRSTDSFGPGLHGDGGMDLRTTVVENATQWGKYEPAIRRWETLTRTAPPPTEPNAKGKPHLSAAFSEWMMGWQAGWVTDVGISRSDQLKIIGNGVVPQQAVAALAHLLTLQAVA